VKPNGYISLTFSPSSHLKSFPLLQYDNSKKNNMGMVCVSTIFMLELIPHMRSPMFSFLHSPFCRAEGLCQHATIKVRGVTPKRTNHSEAGKLKLACDWSTRFMRVISLGLSSVNRFCSKDWDTAKCVKVVYKSVHILYSPGWH
jgi:hypothetical protein